MIFWWITHPGKTVSEISQEFANKGQGNWTNLSQDHGDLIISRTRSIIVRSVYLNDHKNVYGHSEYKNITVV